MKEKNYFLSLKTGIDWSSTNWDCKEWFFHRGSATNHSIIFRELGKRGQRDMPPLPQPFMEFCKAILVYFVRTRNVEFLSLMTYIGECRRLFKVLKERNEETVVSITRDHFERALELYRESGAKAYYECAIRLKVIADIIDKHKLSNFPIELSIDLTPPTSRHYYNRLTEDSEDARKDDDKLPSYEAMAAYAQCTNNPINDDEEILLRTIDLLIAMGQRGNEVVLIPYDCWVEKQNTAADGLPLIDGNGERIIKAGIRYYAEKKSIDKVHWLADQDVKFAKRAVDRLKELTKQARKVARWQEMNVGKIWNIPVDEIIDDDTILKYLNFACHRNLHVFLERNGVNYTKLESDLKRVNSRGSTRYKRKCYYKAGEVEQLLKKKFLSNHVQLKKRNAGKWKVVLTTSQLLSIRYMGSFQFKVRGDFKNKLVVDRVRIHEINYALGTFDSMQSIFERRNLTEADGTKIRITSHQPRHWRNTLYELAGMSNVQQALAMGRQRIDQNPTYQHTSLLERTQAHRDYLTFKSPREKIQFLHMGIREQKILGEITSLYHQIKNRQGVNVAESFLQTHATAIHVTPFGGCTHDFSQAPCPKHLQCWNGCGHLHRTNNPGESERIQEQIDLSKVVLNSMRMEAEGEFGGNVWIKDLEGKIENMQKALDIKPIESPIKIFPEGKQFTVALEDSKGSSVSE